MFTMEDIPDSPWRINIAHLTVMEIEELEDNLREKATFLDPDPERIKIVYKSALADLDEVKE